LIDAMGVFWLVESRWQIRKIMLKRIRTQKGFSRAQNVGDQGGPIVLIHRDDCSACQFEHRAPRTLGCGGYWVVEALPNLQVPEWSHNQKRDVFFGIRMQ